MDGTLAQGSRVGRYRVDAIVARGGMGIVYRATDAALERPVALKVIAPELGRDEEFRARFVRESRLAAALDHPNVIPVYEAGDEDGTLFLAMRLVEGSDLREVIGLEGRLEAGRATRIVAQVAGALDAAHARGLVHRDVKPANVLLAGSPGAEHAYLTDFGIAKRQETSGLTQKGQMLGTVDYAAPEQISGETVDARTDVYALGCLLFEALTGEVPFPRPTAPAAMIAHLQEAPPLLSQRAAELSTSFDRVLHRALAKSPDERFPSAGDLGAAATAAHLRATPREPERTVPSGPPAKKPPSAPKRRRWPLALAGLLLLVAAAAAALLLTGVLGGDDEGEGDRAAPRVTGPTAPPQSGEAVPEAQANALADRYVAAYEGEDLDAMRAIIAPEVVLNGPGTNATGRGEVLGEYRSTFALIEDPQYELRNRTFLEQRNSSLVQGDYEVTDAASGATPSGRLLLTMEREGGQPLIVRILTTG